MTKLENVTTNLSWRFQSSPDDQLRALMFNDLKYADLTIKCSDSVELKCHSKVLSVEYPKMFAIFHKLSLESTDLGTFHLTEVNSIVAKEILRWIYCKKIEGTTKIITPLINFAGSYQVDDLKDHCLQALENLINVKHVATVLTLAQYYNNSSLKQKCIDFIKFEYEKVSQEKSFLEMKKELLFEIMDSMVKDSFAVVINQQ